MNGLNATTGAVVGTDTVQVAIEKVEKGLIDALAVLGVARNALNLGVFSGFGATLYGATATVKGALQAVADFLGNLRVGTFSAVTTLTVLDAVPVSQCKTVKWYVDLEEDATPTKRRGYDILATNDGTDPTDENVRVNKLGAGNISGLDVTTRVAGGNMELIVTSTSAVSGKWRRITAG